MRRYARGVDRNDWALVRSTYHPDAYDDHAEYKGGVDGLIVWLEERFGTADNGAHFIGNCLAEFVTADLALVETYFTSQRVLNSDSTTPDWASALLRVSSGRYVDRFERRDGEWRVARRTIVLDTVLSVPVRAASRTGAANWGQRSKGDFLYRALSDLAGPVSPA
jgi:hypothetical protein